MLKHPRITEARIARAIELLKDRIYSHRAPLTVEIFGDLASLPLPTQIPVSGFRPFSVGEKWGPAWSTAWFRFTAAIPSEWSGLPVAALIRLGALSNEGFTAEGLVWQEGRPTRAINVNRADVPLTSSANGGEQISFLVEAAANPSPRTWLPYGDPDPAPAAPLFTLQHAELACFNPVAWNLHHDLAVAHGAMLELPEHSPRRGQLLRACNDAANILDPADSATYTPARDALRPALAATNGTSTHHISAIGHAHIDTAWLWPLRETIRKCARTFATQLAYMHEHPEYIFACSQPQHYAWMREYHPAIYAGIREAIHRGQWEPTGSMWVEADCNIPSGESLIRQLLHGKNYFIDEFGIETRDCWLPDVFGYSASLPQILALAGIDSFLTQKICWSQFNEFPHHTFLWEGIDGTQIFTHFPPAENYNATFTPHELAFAVKNFREHDRATRSLLLFGYGDGGGGPTREMLATAARVKDFEGLPKVRLERAADFFAKAKADATDLPVWSGELYLELHRGTYTTQARTKKSNRKSEILLRETELFDVLAGRSSYTVLANVAEETRAIHDIISRNAATPAAYLDRAWKLLLLNQFHDIIPGTSIARVYEDAAADYATISALAHAIIQPARQSLLDRIDTSSAALPVIVFNASPIAREEVISLPDGTPIRVEVPATGYAVIDAAEHRRVASFAHPVSAIARSRVIALDNGMIRIIFDRATGNIRAIKDHRRDREVLLPGTQGNIFQLHRDLPNAYDAWDIDPFAFETSEDIAGLTGIGIVEQTDLRAAIRIQRRFGASTITQRIVLTAGSTRIDFQTDIDWHEQHKLLKVAFPVNIRSSRATYEIQFGHVERPTHSNTSWDAARFEVCAQRWADLSEPDYGVALLNDCKYGYDIRGSVMRLSLLRGPTAPDLNADRGPHQFTYSLLPHTGDLRAGCVIEQATALNMPLHLFPAEPRKAPLPARRSFFEIDKPGLLIDTVKYSESGDTIIVRLYESYGARGTATLTTTLPVRHAFHADLLERTGPPIPCASGAITFPIKPFEILTFKLVLG
jgi:alpha-mannosidase